MNPGLWRPMGQVVAAQSSCTSVYLRGEREIFRETYVLLFHERNENKRRR